MTDTNELDYSRKVADGERLKLIMRQVASRFKLDGNVLAEALLDIHERLKAVEGATEELTAPDRWKAFKTVQLAKPSPSASGDTVTAIDAVAQDENGELTATKKNIRQGTTSRTGIVQLSDATNSTSTTLAATANAVKQVYDLAASKQDALGITSSGSSTKFLNEQGKFVTVTTPDVSGKADKVTGATAGDVATLDANGNLVDSGVTLDPSTNTIAANISGNAATATAATTASSATVLANPRNIHVNLESNTGANFNGSASIKPGVTGVLPTSFGGTGYSSVDAAPTEGSNKMVVSGGVWNFSAPANLGTLTGADASPGNDFDRFAVLVTGSVRLQLDWLRKKSGRVIEFYNLNDYEIPIKIVFKHSGEKAFLHRRGAHTLTINSNGEGSNAQELRSLSYKGYIKLYTNYNADTGYYEFYEISDFIHLTGSVTTSMIGNVGTSGTIDSRTGMIYHNDIVCNHASGNYAINVERLVIGQVYRFQFLTKTGYTYLYNNGTASVTVYTGDSSFTIGSKKNANIQASSSAMASHTVSVVRMTATQVYIIWGY